MKMGQTPTSPSPPPPSYPITHMLCMFIVYVRSECFYSDQVLEKGTQWKLFCFVFSFQFKKSAHGLSIICHESFQTQRSKFRFSVLCFSYLGYF